MKIDAFYKTAPSKFSDDRTIVMLLISCVSTIVEWKIAFWDVEINSVHAKYVSRRIIRANQKELKTVRVTLGVQMAAKAVTILHASVVLVLFQKVLSVVKGLNLNQQHNVS